MWGFSLLIVVAAIIVLFAEELSKVFKKFFKKTWARVLVPLFFASFAWAWHDEFLPLALLWLQSDLKFLVASIAGVMPRSMHWLVQALCLFVLSSVPALLLFWHMTRQSITRVKMGYVTRVYATTWLFFAMLFVII